MAESVRVYAARSNSLLVTVRSTNDRLTDLTPPGHTPFSTLLTPSSPTPHPTATLNGSPRVRTNSTISPTPSPRSSTRIDPSLTTPIATPTRQQPPLSSVPAPPAPKQPQRKKAYDDCLYPTSNTLGSSNGVSTTTTDNGPKLYEIVLIFDSENTAYLALKFITAKRYTYICCILCCILLTILDQTLSICLCIYNTI